MKKISKILISLLVFVLLTFSLWWLFDAIKPMLGIGACDCLPKGVVCTACPITLFGTLYIYGAFVLTLVIALLFSIFVFHKIGGEKK